jgi:hypothetical protein
MTATNKRLLISKSHGDSNRCTPCRGKPDQHVTYTSQSSPCMPGVRFIQAVPVHNNLSLAPIKSKQTPTPGKSLDNQRQTGSAVVLGGLILPPIRQHWNRGERFQPMVIQLHQFTGPISPACDQYIQYLLTGANPSVLNRHRRGYNLGGADLPHTHF